MDLNLKSDKQIRPISAPVKYAFTAALKAAGYDSKTQKIDENKVDVKAAEKQKIRKVLREFYDTKPVPQFSWSKLNWLRSPTERTDAEIDKIVEKMDKSKRNWDLHKALMDKYGIHNLPKSVDELVL